MRICENGIIREMTPEEVAEYEALAQEAPMPEPTAEGGWKRWKVPCLS